MTKQERRGFEAEIAVDDRDVQRRFGRRLRAGALLACHHDGWANGSYRRYSAAQQHPIGQSLARIDRVERLLSVGKSIDQKIRGLGVLEEADVSNRISGKVAARTIASDSGGWDEHHIRAIDLPPSFGWHNEVIRRSKKLIDARIEKPMQHISRRVVVRHQRRIGVRRRTRRSLQLSDRITLRVHRVQARDVARGVIGKPHQTIRHEFGPCRERIVRKHFEDVRDETDGSFPTIRCRQRRPVVRRSDEHRPPQGKAPGQRPELTCPLDKRAQHQATPGMRDNVERRCLFRQALEEHAGVLFRCATQAEVIKCKNAVIVGVFYPLEEGRAGKGVERRSSIRERAMEEKQRASGQNRLS